MALGFIDFLLGGKKGNKPQKGAQPAQPVGQAQQGTNQAQGTSPQTPPTQTPQGGDKPQFQDANAQAQQNAEANPQAQGAPVNKTKITEVITSLTEQIKDSNEKLTGLVTDMKALENNVTTLTHRVDEVEESKKTVEEKLSEIDTNMTKFLSLYEMVNNQFNPFIDHSGGSSEKSAMEPPVITIDAQGSSSSSQTMPGDNSSQASSGDAEKKNSEDKSSELPSIAQASQEQKGNSSSSQQAMPSTPQHINIPQANQGTAAFNAAISYEMSLLELDTLDIEEAAGAAVPLTHLRNNTNSLVTILSWLEYLIKRVGIEGTRDGLRYYTETLRWITPEVFFDLDKYLKGMKEKQHNPDLSLSVKDHIVSLYFISKLNDKALDEKLTTAVLQIIKH